MGQLFNRIRNFARSSFSTELDREWAERILREDDEELRRIIDELPPVQPKRKLPADVLRAHTQLNIPVGASTEDMKKAYRTAIATWHPDRFAQASAEDQTKAQHQARAINAAYLLLKDFYQFR